MADFTIADARVEHNEGEYSNNPQDRGGETYGGISYNSNPSWPGWALINARKASPDFPANLKGYAALQAAEVEWRRTEYWNRILGDQMLDQDIANEVYDQAIHFGTFSAGYILQRSLNILNNQGKRYPDVRLDGTIGPVTLGILNTKANADAVYKALNGFQFMKYAQIVENNPSQEQFMVGWLNRI